MVQKQREAAEQVENAVVSEAEAPPVEMTWADYLEQPVNPVPGWIQNGLECAGETQERKTTAGWDKLVSAYPHRITY